MAFSDDEKKAMQQRAEELRSTKGLKGAAKLARELEACVEVIDGLSGIDALDAEIAATFHRIVGEEAPDLAPKTMYGFPAYADGEGKVVMFVQPRSKYDTRYATVNFDERAKLDDGELWPTSFAVTAMSDAVEQTLRELVRRAVAA